MAFLITVCQIRYNITVEASRHKCRLKLNKERIWTMCDQSKDNVNSTLAKRIKIKINIFGLGDYQTKSVEKLSSESILSLLVKKTLLWIN